MKKASAGIVCVLLAIVIAVFSVGCNGGGELTYTGDSQQSSSDNITPVGSSEQPASSEPSTTQSSASTVLYQLTTQQGETVQVLTTSAPLTETPTMNYDPVTVPVMPTTTYYTTAPYTTQYVAPTYSPNADNQVTTKAPATTTTQASTEPQRKYVSVSSYNTDGNFTDSKITLYVAADSFGKKINAKSGSLVINYNSTTYRANYKVLSSLYAGESVQIDIGVPSALLAAVETSDGASITIDVPKDAIVSDTNVANKAFRSIPIYY